MLPHVANRPVSLVRCPDGSEKPCFYQKHVNHMLPPGIGSVEITDKKSGKPEPYITFSSPEALSGLAQMGVLEVHPWGSQNDDLEHPDRIIIDLDPDPSIPWPTLAAAAADVRKQLKQLGLESFPQKHWRQGSARRLPHQQPEYGWPIVKQFAHSFVLQMQKQNPGLYLTTMSKAARKDRIFLDYLRNERGATAVSAYSPRARAGAPVSVPLNWTELKLPDRPSFSVANFGEWSSRLKRDPWKALTSTRQHITKEALALFKIST